MLPVYAAHVLKNTRHLEAKSVFCCCMLFVLMKGSGRAQLLQNQDSDELLSFDVDPP